MEKASDLDVVKRGWLQKESPPRFGLVKVWQKRYVVLYSDAKLRYYGDEKDVFNGVSEKGLCDLGEIEFLEIKQGTNCLSFKLKSVSRVYSFKADSQGYMLEWLQCFIGTCGLKDNCESDGRYLRKDNDVTDSRNGKNLTSKMGWVSKKSRNANVLFYQRRFVRVSGFQLKYYVNDYTDKESGASNLNNLMSIDIVEDLSHTITFVCKNEKPHVFRMDSDGDLSEWWKILCERCPEHVRDTITTETKSIRITNFSPPLAGTSTKDAKVYRNSNFTDSLGNETTTTINTASSEITDNEVYGDDHTEDDQGLVLINPHDMTETTVSTKKRESITALNTAECYIMGFLGKKSKNKLVRRFNTFQERFVTISKGDQHLRYYLTEADATDKSKALNAVDLNKAEFVRSFDTASDCTVFEIGAADRTFVFDTDSSNEKDQWIAVIAEIIEVSKTETKKQQGWTSGNAIEFDEDRTSYSTNLQAHFDSLVEQCQESSKRHYDTLNLLILCLDDLLADIKQDLPPHYEAMAFAVNTINDYINEIWKDLDDNTIDRNSMYELVLLISEYKIKLNMMYCPSEMLRRDGCLLFQKLLNYANIYVYGSLSNEGSQGGSSALLREHINNIMSKLNDDAINMIDRQPNGTFCTQSPILVWNIFYQHIKLAEATQYDYLLVLVISEIMKVIGEVVVESMTKTTERLADKREQNRLKTIDEETPAGDEEDDAYLELLCSLINDTAVHLENSLTILEVFKSHNVREKVTKDLEKVQSILIDFANVAMEELISLILTDVEHLYRNTFREEWLEGDNNMEVILQVVTDYMQDFETFLTPFWYNKLVSILMEKMVIHYIVSVVVHHDDEVADARPNFLPSAKSSNQINEENPVVIGDDASFGKIMHDLNAMRVEFTKYVNAFDMNDSIYVYTDEAEGQQAVAEALEILEDMTTFCMKDVNEVASDVMSRISSFPSSSEAIEWFAVTCLRMRDDVDEDDIEDFKSLIEPAVLSAPHQGDYNEVNQIMEEYLGTIYDSLYEYAGLLDKRDSGFHSLDFTNVPSSTKSEGTSSRHGNALTKTVKKVMKIPIDSLRRGIMPLAAGFGGESPLDCLSPHSAVMHLKGKRKEMAKARRTLRNSMNEALLKDEMLSDVNNIEMESQENATRLIVSNFSSKMKKMSPTGLWQQRFYKLSTQPVNTLLWYKKAGGSVIGSMKFTFLSSMSVKQSKRALAVHKVNGTVELMTSVIDNEQYMPMDGLQGESAYIFEFFNEEDQKYRKVSKDNNADTFLTWINLFIAAGNLKFDAVKKMWFRET